MRILLAIATPCRYEGGMSHPPSILFDRTRLRKQRARRAAQFPQHDFLLQEAAASLADSLAAITYRFPTVVELGASGHLAPLLQQRPGTVRYITCDSTTAFAPAIIADEECLPFADASLDAVLSANALHWVNDLPGCLVQIRRALKPDGLFMAILPGPDTLRELRQCFAEAEAMLSGGLTPRIAPFPDVRDAGGLLQRAGFALPVIDRDILSISYENLAGLMADLRGIAQSNMLQQRVQHFTGRGFFQLAEKIYRDRFADAEGRLTATVEFVTMTAWAPAANQQQPAKRGSGQISLTNVFN